MDVVDGQSNGVGSAGNRVGLPGGSAAECWGFRLPTEVASSIMQRNLCSSFLRLPEQLLVAVGRVWLHLKLKRCRSDGFGLYNFRSMFTTEVHVVRQCVAGEGAWERDFNNPIVADAPLIAEGIDRKSRNS